MLSTSGEVFAGFGRSKFVARRTGRVLELSKAYRDVRSSLRAECPALPGVYGMIDCEGRLIYVGVSRNLRKRTITYFQRSATAGRKETRVASRTTRLVWETAGHELLALLRERELIRRFTPEMNVRDRRRVRLAYVYLTVEDAPRFDVSARLPKACRYHWGPVARSRSLIRGAEALNHHFRLPDCPSEMQMRYRDEPGLFRFEMYPQCLRGEVQRCLAPCSGSLVRADYFAQLNRARAFLMGRDDAPIEEIDRAMRDAVALRRFERAASLRDFRATLVQLRDRLLPRASVLPESFVYRLMAGRRFHWLVFHKSQVMKVAAAPTDGRQAAMWRAQLEEIRRLEIPPVEQSEAGESQIVQSWFRRKPGEMGRVMDSNSAIQLCEEVLRQC